MTDLAPPNRPQSHDAASGYEFERPAEQDERRALIWLTDRRDWQQHSPIERRYAATLIQTLAYFEERDMAIGSYRAGERTPEARRIQAAARRGALKAKQASGDPARCPACLQAMRLVEDRLFCGNIDCARYGQ